jgi:hypothetical protein
MMFIPFQNITWRDSYSLAASGLYDVEKSAIEESDCLYFVVLYHPQLGLAYIAFHFFFLIR